MNSRLKFHPLPPSRIDEMVNLSKLLNSIFLAAFIAIGMISINVIRGGVNLATLSVVGLFFLTTGLYWVFKQGYYRIAGMGLTLSIAVVVTYNFSVSGGIHDNAMVVLPVLITVGGLVLGKRYIPYLTGLLILDISWLYWLSVTGRITPFGGSIEVRFQNFVTVVILLLISGLMIWLTVNTLEKNFLRIIRSEEVLRDSYDQVIMGWGKALELFDQATEGHSMRVSEQAVALGKELGLNDRDLTHIRRGALLHDIGKMGVAEFILNKPESLSREERQQVEKHPLNAHKLLKDIPFLEQAMEIPVYHHENWDGTGYPYRLAGEEIPLSARIFSLVDNWDALRSDRPYRKAWPKDQVIQYIQNQSGKKFDPDLVEPFLSLVI